VSRYKAAPATPYEHGHEALNPTRGTMGWVVVDSDDCAVDLRPFVAIEHDSYLEEHEAQRIADYCNACAEIVAAFERLKASRVRLRNAALVDDAFASISGGIGYLDRRRVIDGSEDA
jgi:hypothetical protein